MPPGAMPLFHPNNLRRHSAQASPVDDTEALLERLTLLYSCVQQAKSCLELLKQEYEGLATPPLSPTDTPTTTDSLTPAHDLSRTIIQVRHRQRPGLQKTLSVHVHGPYGIHVRPTSRPPTLWNPHPHVLERLAYADLYALKREWNLVGLYLYADETRSKPLRTRLTGRLYLDEVHKLQKAQNSLVPLIYVSDEGPLTP